MPLSSISSSTSPYSGRRGRGSSSATEDGSNDLPLLCSEDAGSFSDEEGGGAALPQPRQVLPFPPGVKYADLEDDGDGEEEEEEVVAMWVGTEADYSLGLGYRARFLGFPGSLDAAARRRSVGWILKVREFYRFRPATAYLAVNFVDRFITHHALPQQPGGWPMQLLSVACLSLAAKMEETLVPSLLDLQVKDAGFLFEPRTIQRMELLVLDALDWRLRSVTPFAFLGFFACRADTSRAYTRCLASRATHIILATIEEIEFLDHCPSIMAAAAIICAAGEVPSLPFISLESAASWCAGLTTDGITNCYQLMQELAIGSSSWEKQRPRSGVLPQLRITSVSMGSGVLSSSSSAASNKRRKISSRRWVDDGKARPMREDDGIN